MMKNILGLHGSRSLPPKPHPLWVTPKPHLGLEPCSLAKETLASLGFSEFSYRFSVHVHPWHKGQSARCQALPAKYGGQRSCSHTGCQIFFMHIFSDFGWHFLKLIQPEARTQHEEFQSKWLKLGKALSNWKQGLVMGSVRQPQQ